MFLGLTQLNLTLNLHLALVVCECVSLMVVEKKHYINPIYSYEVTISIKSQQQLSVKTKVNIIDVFFFQQCLNVETIRFIIVANKALALLCAFVCKKSRE